MTKEELYNKRNVAYEKADVIFDVAYLTVLRIRDEAWAVADNEYRVGLAKLTNQEGRK